MPMYTRIKISKRVKNKLPMITPGTRDNDILPSSGGASNSGITLDYSAINMGGIDNGVPYNHADDGYENDIDDDNDNKSRGAFVGSREEGFPIRHNLDYGSTANLSAIVVKGNAKFVMDNATAEEFYEAVANYLRELGYKVSFDVSETRDLIHKADLVIGHSNGLYKLNRCKESAKLIAIGAIPEKATNSKIVFANHPTDEAYLKKCHYRNRYDYPIPEHFIFTNEMKVAIDEATIELWKKAFPDWPQYNGNSQMYEQVNERPDAFTTPQFNMWNTYYADDKHICSRCDFEAKTAAELNKHLKDKHEKKAMPLNLPQYSDPNQYEQIVNPRNTTEPEFDIFETYFADDVPERGPLQRERKKTEQELIGERGPLQRERPKAQDLISTRGPLQREVPRLIGDRGPLQRERPRPQQVAMNTPSSSADDVIEVIEPETIEVVEAALDKKAFIKTAITFDSNPVIQSLINIPEVKAIIEQHGSGFVDKVVVTTPSADVQQTQQQLKPNAPGVAPITLQPISGNPYGHMWTSEDPTTHQKKPLDKIVRIDRVTDQWGTLVTILHEIGHHRHPDWSEAQVESEAENLAGTVKQHLGAPKDASGKTNLFFVKASKFHITPMVSCDVADTYQKQVTGLQSYSSLGPNSGLLFTYSNPQPLTFWMGKVSFPIDIIFADQNNQIVKIYRNCQPKSADLYSCDKASRVIEVVGSFCAFHDIDVGDHVFYADDDNFKKHLFEKLKEIKIEQQKDLDMTDWNVKIVMKKNPDNRRFLKVSWTPEDYKMKKADILVNPALLQEALKEMPLEKLIRHALLHILAGAKNELPEDKEQRLITDKLY